MDARLQFHWLVSLLVGGSDSPVSLERLLEHLRGCYAEIQGLELTISEIYEAFGISEDRVRAALYALAQVGFIQSTATGGIVRAAGVPSGSPRAAQATRPGRSVQNRSKPRRVRLRSPAGYPAHNLASSR